MSRFHSTHCFRPTTQIAEARHGALALVCLGMAFVSLFGARAAQAESRYYGGARLAVTIADVKSELEHDPRFGVGGGVFVAGQAWKEFDVRIEANYVQKGAHIAFSRTAIEWQMDYVEVPVFLVWNIMPKTQTSVELYGGVSYGFPLNRQVEQGDNLGYMLEDWIDTPFIVNPTTVLRINEVEDADLAFALGIGLSVPVGQVNFLVDARYTRSITDPVVSADYIRTIGDDEDAVTTVTNTDFSNRVFSFYFGFSFPFGSRTAPEPE